jgi:hypothetical protein
MTSKVDLSSLPANHPVLLLMAARMNLNEGFSSVHNLWAIGSAGLLHTLSKTPLPDEERPEWFYDEEFMKTQTNDADAALHAAVLILAHTVSSEVITDLCTTSLSADPKAWEQFIQGKKLTIADIRDTPKEKLISHQLDDYRKHITENKYLTHQCSNLWKVVGPVNCKTVVKGYVYSQAQLEEINNLRKQCVHGFRFKTKISDLRSTVQYLYNTVRFFGGLVQKKHSLYTGEHVLDDWQ